MGKFKILSSFLSGSKYPIWKIYKDGEYIDFYDRKTDKYDGLTKEELLNLLKS